MTDLTLRAVATPEDGSLGAEPALDELEARLIAWFRSVGSALIGFSGGVDSAYLACVALESVGPAHVLGVIGRSASYPLEQWQRARDVATRFGLPVLELDTHELTDPRYAANPVNRCYYCKTELWDQLVPVAMARGIAVVCDGTNADDLADYRPGRAAAREHGVRSPLAELGFTKAHIRALSARRDIPTWSVPSSPCLSSRLPYGTAVTVERLVQVEQAERGLRELGIVGDLRVRHHGPVARVELGAAELAAWLSPVRARVLCATVRKAGYQRVVIDLRGFRSGSLNVLGGVHP